MKSRKELGDRQHSGKQHSGKQRSGQGRTKAVGAVVESKPVDSAVVHSAPVDGVGESTPIGRSAQVDTARR